MRLLKYLKESITMEIKDTTAVKKDPKTGKRGKGDGVILFGEIEKDPHKWFEKRFDTREKAEKFAKKKNWKIK